MIRTTWPLLDCNATWKLQPQPSRRTCRWPCPNWIHATSSRVCQAQAKPHTHTTHIIVLELRLCRADTTSFMSLVDTRLWCRCSPCTIPWSNNSSRSHNSTILNNPRHYSPRQQHWDRDTDKMASEPLCESSLVAQLGGRSDTPTTTATRTHHRSTWFDLE